MRKVQISGRETWVHMDGAVHKSSCGCDIGLRLPAGSASCESCTEGMICEGMGEVLIQPRYQSGPDLSIFHCRGNPERCVGGKPGETCAFGRKGISCAECEDGTTPNADDGYVTCRICDGVDSSTFILVVIVGILALIAVYLVIATQDHTKQRHSILLLAMTLSIFVTTIQQLGIIAMVSVEIPEPMRTMFSLVQLFSFDINVLNFNCVASAPAPARFAIKVLILVFCTVVLLLIHAIWVIFRHGGRFVEQMPTLIAGIGTLCVQSLGLPVDRLRF